jgi:glycosyltransferase involved in cell wall biosynthesis
MRVLALEPYYGGSHRAFLDGWSARSRHAWTVLGLPARKWKWRMRHAAITFGEAVSQRAADGEAWDMVFCSDMLKLGEFLGLAGPAAGDLPSVAYFHENQLTYPVQYESERDLHFGFSNLTTALAATQVWFNSAFHRDSFLSAADDLLRRMPDYQCAGAVERVRRKSRVCPPGIDRFSPRGRRAPGPMHILWAARWEYDKNPELLFEALRILKARGVAFRVSVIGESFRDVPPVFAWAEGFFHDEIDRWGYQETRQQYEAALAEADVFVSTAHQEYFGLAAVEAIAAGAWPVLPRRLAYPEVLALSDHGEVDEFFYEGGAAALAETLRALAERIERGQLWRGDPNRGVRRVERFFWDRAAVRLDEALEKVSR